MRLLADTVLILHATFVGFVVVGLALVWLGAWRGWAWVRGIWFRTLHLCAIVLVALEALVGLACPLTLLEDWLRIGVDTQTGFVQRWLQRLLYWDLPAWVFTVTYVCFAGAVALTFVLFPPRRPPA